MTTINSPVLVRYQNGNCQVTLHEDGSKSRTWEGDPKPDAPESIDLKLTDYCDAACPFCHESSTTRGVHARIEDALAMLDGLPGGVEIAIGGGNPLSHPGLEDFLYALADRGLVANVTVNVKHYRWQADTERDDQARIQLARWQHEGVLRGVGVSTTDAADVTGDEWLRGSSLGSHVNHVVWHLIAGVADPTDLTKSGSDNPTPVLVLGYKDYGFGRKHDPKEVQENLHKWRYWLPSILQRRRRLSFDNLAVRQLGVRDIVSPASWERHYMGDDGKFTMYADAVRREYAPSSTSERVPANGRTAAEFFRFLNGR